MPNINMDAIEYIRKIPPPFRSIVEEIRNIIFKTIPEIKENFKYGMPIYEKEEEICFIKKEPKQHVIFGFFNGQSLLDSEKLLNGTDDNARFIIVSDFDEINESYYSDMIKEAIDMK